MAAGAAAILLVLLVGAHILTAFGEAVDAFGALLNNDARFDPADPAYGATYAIGMGVAAVTVVLLLALLRDHWQERRGPGYDLSVHLGWGMVVLGALVSTVGYVIVASTADDYTRVQVTPSDRLGADAVMAGAVLDMVGSLVVVAGAACCLWLLRRLSDRRA